MIISKVRSKSETELYRGPGDKMGFSKTRAVQILFKLGKAFTVFILGSLVVHLLVMLLDYSVMIKPLSLNLHDNFLGSIFSTPMFPMMLAYGFLSLTIYFLWEKKKKVGKEEKSVAACPRKRNSEREGRSGS
jgi:hypothetical protein